MADCLSRYYDGEEGDSTSNEEIDWENTNVHLDPEGDDLPQDRQPELKAVIVEGEPNPRKSKHLAEKRETHISEAREMASAVVTCMLIHACGVRKNKYFPLI